MNRARGLATLALALVLASGCAFLAPARFDPVEQAGYAALWQKAKRLGEACGDDARVRAIVDEMSEMSELLIAYLRYQPGAGSHEIARQFDRLQYHANPSDGSETFCRDSAVNLQEAAARAMQVNGGRER